VPSYTAYQIQGDVVVVWTEGFSPSVRVVPGRFLTPGGRDRSLADSVIALYE
jgi:hypothetical protein